MPMPKLRRGTGAKRSRTGSWRRRLRSLGLLLAFTHAIARAGGEPLSSWNDGAAKSAITSFVASVTKEGSPDFVSPAERIAVFDNDGTLWCEQPVYFQFAFALDRIKALAPKHPEWKGQSPFKEILAGDLKAALAGGEKAIPQLMAVT